MKNKLLLMLFLLVGMLGFTGCEDTLIPPVPVVPEPDVEEEWPGDPTFMVAEKQLVADYSAYTVTDVSWVEKDGYQVGSFVGTAKSAGVSISAWYAIAGEKASRHIDVAKLGVAIPALIKPAFDATVYADAAVWTLDEIELENRYNGETEERVYEVELDNVSNKDLCAEVYFDAVTGGFLFAKEEVDASGDDSDDRYVVDERLKAAVKAIHPEARVIDASKEDGFIEVLVFDKGLEIEMLFTAEFIYKSGEYEVAYSELPAKYSSVNAWISTPANGFPTPEATSEVEIREGAALVIDGVECRAFIELEYSTISGAVENEYELGFYLDADNEIISVNTEGGGVELGKYTNGTFILNEGNMTSEPGDLVFISPSGAMVEGVFELENGKKLPGLTSDLCIANDKIYILSQTGTLTVVNAHSLKLEQEFTSELGDARDSNPTHLAVVGNDVFIRNGADYGAIYRFNLITKTSVFVEGTKYAHKNRMAIIDDKVYATSGSKILMLEEGKNAATKTIIIPNQRQFACLLPSDDGNLWVSGGRAIMKMNVDTYEIESNDVNYNVGAGMFSSPIIGAMGDIVYFTAGIKVICHDFKNKDAATNTTVPLENLCALTGYDRGMFYNGLGVESASKKLYINFIKGYGNDYRYNKVLVFDIKSDKLELNTTYEDKTRFPGGFHFTSTYED